MNDALAHRGPDDSGVAILRDFAGSPAGALGHRRLSIIDLSSAGHQPMSTPDGRYTLVFNGEIYNYAQLRHELQRAGCSFHGAADTEVLLVGWARYGSAFLDRLRGMYAFAIWDAEQASVTLVRDPFGIKPLYFAKIEGAVLFASEVRALLASGRIPRLLSRPAVRSFLSTGSVLEPLTAVEGIQALPAGTLMEVTVREGRLVTGAPRPYGRGLVYGAEDRFRDGEEASRAIRAALRGSVEHHMVADVPVAFFLSGGIDSSAVVGIAREVTDAPLDTFTVSFAEAEYSEAAPARIVARRFGTRHHEIHLSGEDLLASLPDVFVAMDQPSIDGLNTYVVSRAVRERGIEVVLSGLGGDELFAGYPSFARAEWIRTVWAGLGPFRHVVAGLVGRARGLRAQKLRLLLDRATPAEAGYLASRTLLGDPQVTALTGGAPEIVLPEPARGLSLLQQVAWYELTGYMRNTLLRDSDTFSMAHGLELRVPFVDREVASVAMRLSDTGKVRRGASKPVMVEALRDLLPPEVWDRPKQGFTLPFERWLRSSMYEEIDSLMQPTNLRAAGFAAAPARKIWTDFQARRSGVNWSRPWALYTLLRWAEENRVTLSPAPSSVEPPARPEALFR